MRIPAFFHTRYTIDRLICNSRAKERPDIDSPPLEDISFVFCMMIGANEF